MLTPERPEALARERSLYASWDYGLNFRGAGAAIHIASALDRKCEEFITTDGQAKKMAAKTALADMGLRVIRASETTCLPGKYPQLNMLPGAGRS